ncbi:hypothetical protein DFH06DRAFT_1124046 [Mycena polygramma]|nr:hypothetical protein DFH06DRAFT_1124046 [Mycena polygramma]
MHTLKLPTEPKDRCRCRRVRYCSKACQGLDWKRHKPDCTNLRTEVFVDYSPEKRKLAHDGARFIKWLDPWRTPLLRWAVYFGDLAHQPEDYLESHCFLLAVERNPKSTRLDTLFKPVYGSMWRDADIRELIAGDPEQRAHLTSLFDKAKHGRNIVRMFVLFETVYAFGSHKLEELFPNGSHRTFSDPQDLGAQRLSTHLKQIYLADFSRYMSEGKADADPVTAAWDILLKALFG